MTKLKRKTSAKEATRVVNKLAEVLQESTGNVVLDALVKQIDEYGVVQAILSPFAETIKKEAQLKEKIKNNMIKLGLFKAEGNSFEALREVTQFKALDLKLLEDKLGDLEAYKRDGDRNSIKVTPKVQIHVQRT
jgi:hypothetical protein